MQQYQQQGGLPPLSKPHHQDNTARTAAAAFAAPGTEGEVEVRLRQRDCLIRLPDVMKRTAMGRTKLYDLISKGEFPGPIKVGAASLWSDAEITGWIEQLKMERGHAV